MITFEKKNSKIKICRDFWVSILSPTPKYENSESTEIYKNAIILNYENVASTEVEMFFKSHQTQNDSHIFPIRYQVFVF